MTPHVHSPASESGQPACAPTQVSALAREVVAAAESAPPEAQQQALTVIGELMNNSFARAAAAFGDRDLAGYQNLARLQTGLGAAFLTLNIDGTQKLQVRLPEMLEFLPSVIPAIQEASSTPISFDNPSVDYQRVALQNYDRRVSGQPIINSLAASRERLDEFITLVRDYDTKVVVMASEKFTPDGTAQCASPSDIHEAARYFVRRLREEAGRTNEQIFIDPGLAPVGADTYGLVNMGLDAMRLIRQDPELKGVHIVVGLTNFSFGVPKGIKEGLQRAYLTLAIEAGLDTVLASPEKDLTPLPKNDPLVLKLRDALEQGRPQPNETPSEAADRQIFAVLAICREHLQSLDN